MSLSQAPFARARGSLVLAALVLFTVAGSAAVARAEIAPKARPVIERFIQAVGGRAAVDSIRSTRSKEEVHAFGLSGQTVSFTRAPDHRASVTSLGPIRVLDGYDGETGWRVDPSGKLAILDGKDLESAQGSAYFDNDQWLRPDQTGGSIAFTGDTTDSTGAYTVLEVTPPVGRPRTLWFDRNTGLLARVVAKQDQQVVTSTLSDYREVAGRKFAFHTVSQVTGMPANDITVQVDSLWVNEIVPDAFFSPPPEEDNRTRWLKSPGVATLPFQYRGRHVWLRASVNGKPPADFIFDTGASLTVLDSTYAAGIGVATEGKMQAQGAGASGGAAFATLESVRVEGPNGDGVELRDRKIAVLSVNSILAPFFWRDCAGILGYDFITQFVTTVNFDDSTLTLHDPASFQYQGAGKAVPFQLAGTIPTVPFTLDDTWKGLARVDVGSSSTIDLHAPFVKANDIAGKVGKTLEVTGFGGTFTNRLARVKKMEVGPFSWNDPLISLSSATTGAFASEDYAGNIGNHLLERFICTFDYEHRILYLEPGKRFGERDQFSRAGVQLVKSEGVVTAQQVLSDSPAAKAGLKEGDQIVSIDGRPIAQWHYEEVRGLLEEGEVGRQVTFEISRDGKAKKLKFKLRELI
jgi:hypothetical protein